MNLASQECFYIPFSFILISLAFLGRTRRMISFYRYVFFSKQLLNMLFWYVLCEPIKLFASFLHLSPDLDLDLEINDLNA